MHRLVYGYVLLYCISVAYSCPSQCTCTYHGQSDGTRTRSVLCNDLDMSEMPVNVPIDTVKLRVEKTAIRRIPTEAFYYLVDLRYLWITYNLISSVDFRSFYNLKVLHELRLDGNQISIFPWESLKEMPRLRTLDLHNNRISSLPLEAAQHLVNITYLDLSSNKLTSIPSDFMDIWPPFNGVAVSSFVSQKVLLGLQDNPWFCDCRISKLIELSKMTQTAVVLMDLVLTCVSPENLSGVQFQRAELDRCQKPAVLTSATKVTSSLGSNVLLRCDATGYPTPNLIWTRGDGSPVNNTVVQESPGEGIRWSIISLQGIMEKDAGDYVCKAKNVAGNAETSMTLYVAGTYSTTVAPPRENTGTGSTTLLPTGDFSNMNVSSSTSLSSTIARAVSTTPPSPVKRKTTPSAILQRASPKPPRTKEDSDGKKLAADEKSKRKDSLKSITDLEIVEETTDSAVLLWTADGLPSDTPLTVVYSADGDDDPKLTIDTDAGSGKILLEGLSPGLRYSVCLVAKGSAAGEDPCTEFYTLDFSDDSGEFQLLMIISGAACAVVLPIIVFLLYKIFTLKGSHTPPDDEELEKESYVKFETLSLKQRVPSEVWARRQTNDERKLLCSRSSIDSQLTYKSDGSRNEYLC